MVAASKNPPQVVAALKSPHQKHKQRTRVLERENPERMDAARRAYHEIVDPVAVRYRDTMRTVQAELAEADLRGMEAYERVLRAGA